MLNDLLDFEQIKKNLSQTAKTSLLRLEIFPSIPSTNTYLIQAPNCHCEQNEVNRPLESIDSLTIPKNSYFAACLAEEQTAGRGRQNKSWHSPFGKNLYLSLLYETKFKPHELSGLSIVIGVIVAGWLKQLGVPIQLKWPNDLYCHDKKLGGILIELAKIDQSRFKLVIGIGLNIYMNHVDEPKIPSNWISLQEILDRFVNRNELAAQLLSVLIEVMMNYQPSKFGEYLDIWREYDFLYGKKVVIKTQAGERKGIVIGINERAELLIEHDQAIVAYSSAEVSVMYDFCHNSGLS